MKIPRALVTDVESDEEGLLLLISIGVIIRKEGNRMGIHGRDNQLLV